MYIYCLNQDSSVSIVAGLSRQLITFSFSEESLFPGYSALKTEMVDSSTTLIVSQYTASCLGSE